MVQVEIQLPAAAAETAQADCALLAVQMAAQVVLAKTVLRVRPVHKGKQLLPASSLAAFMYPVLPETAPQDSPAAAAAVAAVAVAPIVALMTAAVAAVAAAEVASGEAAARVPVPEALP
jgi:hypothetical protein